VKEMTARNFEAKNIIVGAATFYVGTSASVNTKLSLTGATVTAQDPTNVNTNAASANWYHLGYTQNGVTMNIQPTYGEVTVDQLLDVAKMFKSGQQVTVATSLTETTLENLYVAIGARTGTSGDLRLKAALDVSNKSIASADGVSTTITDSNHLTGTGDYTGQVQGVLDINGGSLGYEPIERSVCFVGPGPSKLATTANQKAERIYIGYRAVSMDAVGVAVQRDNVTLFPVNFRLMPFEDAQALDGNATYGKIIDRVYGP
jgi:hypothetical protein